jgi:hypothetical protein
MFRSARAAPHLEIEGEGNPARASLFHGELLGNTAALVSGPHVGLGQTEKSRQRGGMAGLPSTPDIFDECRHGR